MEDDTLKANTNRAKQTKTAYGFHPNHKIALYQHAEHEICKKKNKKNLSGNLQMSKPACVE